MTPDKPKDADRDRSELAKKIINSLWGISRHYLEQNLLIIYDALNKYELSILEKSKTLMVSLPDNDELFSYQKKHFDMHACYLSDLEIIDWYRDNIKLIPQERSYKIYRFYCQSMHKVEYTLGYFDNKSDAERMINNHFQQTASGPNFLIEEITIIKEIKEKQESGV